MKHYPREVPWREDGLPHGMHCRRVLRTAGCCLPHTTHVKQENRGMGELIRTADSSRPSMHLGMLTYTGNRKCRL
jgi:hypothetical protein